MRPLVYIEKIGTYSGHTDCIYTICAGFENHEFYTAGGDGMVVKWNLSKPDQGLLISKLENSVYAMVLIAERRLLVICENLKGIRFLDLDHHKEVASIPLPGLTFFDVCSYRNLLIIATHVGKVLLWDLNTLQAIDTLDHCDKSARCMVLNPEAGEFAVGYSDGHIRIFDLGEFHLKKTVEEPHTNSVFSLAYDPHYEYLISTGRDAHIKHWDVKTGYRLLKSTPAHLFAVNHLQFRHDGRYYASCSMDKSIKIWDAQGSLLKVIDKSRHAGHGTSVNKMLWMTDALISVSDDRKVSVWRIDIEASAASEAG